MSGARKPEQHFERGVDNSQKASSGHSLVFMIEDNLKGDVKMAKKGSSKKRKVREDSVEVSVDEETLDYTAGDVLQNDELDVELQEDDAAKVVSTIQMESDGRYRNKQRCLVLCSRGVTARYRHLLEDLRTLLPHHKKESKLDPGSEGAARAVNDIAEIRSCNSVLFLECRKRQDAYLWMGKVGQSSGPSVRFHVTNIHTMDELRLTGNCMKGSRPILSFDESFGRLEHLKFLKELFVDVFGTPRGHPKSKPFVDRVMAFYYADNKIWVRNYQILEQQASNALEAHLAKKESGQNQSTSLVEIGPRFVLNPVRIFRGSFGGQTLYRNPDFVSPNEIRAAERRKKGSAYMDRKDQQKRRKVRKEELVAPEDPLDSVFR